MTAASPSVQGTILVVDDEAGVRKLVAAALERAGYEVSCASDGAAALEVASLAGAPPDLIISDVTMPEMDGFELLRRLRADPATRAIPVIMLTARDTTEDLVAGLDLGADDYLSKPFRMAELLARVRAKVERPPLPRELLPQDRQTGLLSERRFWQEVERELTRARRSGAAGTRAAGGRSGGIGAGSVAYLDLDELPRLRERLGARAETEIARQVAALIRVEASTSRSTSRSTSTSTSGRGTGTTHHATGEAADPAPARAPARARKSFDYEHGAEIAGRDGGGRFSLLMPEASAESAQRRLEQLSRRIAGHPFTAGSERVRLTPVIGYATFSPGTSAERLRQEALLALDGARSQLDLHPVQFGPSLAAGCPPRRGREDPLGGAHTKPSGGAGRSGFWKAARTPFQIVLTLLAGLVFPFVLYVHWGAAGRDLARIVYLLASLAMFATAILITIESFLALRRIEPPEPPGSPYPTASAIIAAYLPNEAATVVETVEAFLRLEYPGELQVILAYNTPRDLPVEATLQEIAAHDPRFLPLRVIGSTSKAQNVNAALAEVKGEFVGVFDADHHPDPDSFTRAWRWLSSGYDVVQGHCLVRNGDASWVARMVAVEFETIYTVSHPGRARLHGFGVFGGSNGYWKSDLLRQTRMQGFMLTEDIDSSLRVIAAGHQIASDPYLVSRELAPVTLKALWHQRMRWAQGWFQVSFRHLERGLRSPHLTLRQKLGLAQLLGWRELFPWLSLQIVPILGYWAGWRGERLNWFVPFFLFTSLAMLSNRPAQILFTYRLADPEIRRHKSWFWFYSLTTLLFYMEMKNLISRVAQIKELMRERQWVVTPRAREG